MMMPGIVASSRPPRPAGEPRWTICGSGRYGWPPVPVAVIEHGAAVRAVLLDLETGEASAPGEAPEVPDAAVEVHLLTLGIARVAVTRNDAERHRSRRAVVTAAQLHRHPVVVGRDVVDVRAFLHAEDLALVAGIPLVAVEDHHRDLAFLQILLQG